MPAPRGDDVLTQSHAAVSDARDYFNLLPNEIFTMILDLSLEREIDSESVTNSNTSMVRETKLLHLTLVNHRFNAFATPHLYKCIEVIYPGNRLIQTRLEFLRLALNGNASLRPYIREFRLQHGEIRRYDRKLDRRILEILGWATHLTHLILSGSFAAQYKIILNLIKVALANSTSLRHLPVCDMGRKVSTKKIIKVLTGYPSNIQELLLDGVVCSDESIPSFVPLQLTHLESAKPAISGQQQNNDTASLRTLHLHNVINNPETTTNSLLKWSKSLEKLSLREWMHSDFEIDSKVLLLPYKDTLVALHLDLRILPDRIDFSSFAALEKLTLVYWPLFASSRVEFSEDMGRRLLAPQMRRLNWLLAGSSRPTFYVNSLTTFDEKWLCDLGEYATQHCPRLRIIHAKHNPELRFYIPLLPRRHFTIDDLDMPWDIFGRVQLFFETLGPNFL